MLFDELLINFFFHLNAYDMHFEIQAGFDYVDGLLAILYYNSL